jgi:hypothetical protein
MIWVISWDIRISGVGRLSVVSNSVVALKIHKLGMLSSDVELRSTLGHYRASAGRRPGLICSVIPIRDGCSLLLLSMHSFVNPSDGTGLLLD